LVEKIPVDDKRFNLFAYFEKRSRYSAILCTHLDTVAPFIEPKIEASLLWGRGACDAKGIAAAMIYAMLEQKDQGFLDLALLLTVGEEESSDGARAAQKRLAGGARFLIVGEPTELQAAFAQKGTVVFDLVTHGHEAHSAMPHLGESAIHSLINNLE